MTMALSRIAWRIDGRSLNRAHNGVLGRGPTAVFSIALLIFSGTITARADGPGSDGAEYFEKNVRPLLVERCYQCHSGHSKKVRGGLLLDSPEGWTTGGDRGPAVEPGKPDESLIIEAVRYDDEDLQMPPKKKLPDREIAVLTRWVAMGAPGPIASASAKGAALRRPKARHGVDIGKGKTFWAFQPPVAAAVPEVRDRAWPQTPIDRFVLAELEKAGVRPAPPADRRTLIRRATFDLIGLPPTVAETEAFLKDDAPGAFARVVERLLESPHYGERWGRHWLDVARYADSNGLDENIAFGNAWRYRDYVIAAFNRDKPFDQFLVEQLAGDLLPAEKGETDARRFERLIATGFLSLGPKVLAEPDAVKMEMDIVDEQIDTVGRTFLGLTLGCARCHDHKFDPLPTTDYYALAGIFRSTRTMDNFKIVARWHENPLIDDAFRALKAEHDRRVQAQKAAVADLVRKANEVLEKAASPAKGQAKAVAKELEKQYPEATRAELKRLRDELARLEKSAPEPPGAMGVAEGTVADARIHRRGSTQSLGDVVPRRVPLVLASARPGGPGQPEFDARSSGRLELARWMVDPRNPLVGRVMVNRIWRWHFGRGIVGTPDNFGALGDRPADGPLLDWLARRFIAEGWSIKAMHRLIMLSSTYQMGHAFDPAAARTDPEDRLQWRFRPRRLDAESIHDALLAVGGALDLTMGGSLLTVKNRDYFFNHTSKDATRYASRRRAVYLPVVRNHMYDVFDLFDYSDASVATGDRATTTVAPQALFMLNGDLVMDVAEALAARLLKHGDERPDGARSAIEALYLRAYGRPATAAERARGEAFLERFERTIAPRETDAARRKLLALRALCQAVLASNEFLYVD